MLKNHPSKILAFALLLLISACAVEPQPINYGQDACHYCKMNIVDSQHAAEYVTAKGKVYKFDAIECMLNQMRDVDQSSIALYLVTDYAQPGELVDAQTGTYLISESIPSPMGAFLTGFSTEENAVSTHKEVDGELYKWDQLKSKYGL